MLIQPIQFRTLADRRQGYVLIAVLVVIVVLTLAAYRYSDMMMAERQLSDRILKHAQAKALADSGIHYAIAMLSGQPRADHYARRDRGRLSAPGSEAESVPPDGPVPRAATV